MRWAVLGSKGMFGTEIQARLIETNSSVTGFSRENFDIEWSEQDVARTLGKFDVVVNAIAYTAVDKAESQQDLATSVNGLFAGKLAQACSLSGSKLLHISTDYVFDGTAEQAYEISANPSPRSVYGRSKLLGEQLIQNSSSDYAIFRTSWLYGQYGRCFPKVIAGLLRDRNEISVVADQVGSPTWTRDLADVVIDHVLMSRQDQLVHAVASGSTTWHEFAMEIRESLPPSFKKNVRAITTEEFPTPAVRPAFSVLANNENTGEVIGDWLERWKVAAPSVLSEFL